MKKLTGSMAQKFMDANLHLESRITVLLVKRKIGLGDERDFLVGSFSRENVTQTDILKSL